MTDSPETGDAAELHLQVTHKQGASRSSFFLQAYGQGALDSFHPEILPSVIPGVRCGDPAQPTMPSGVYQMQGLDGGQRYGATRCTRSEGQGSAPQQHQGALGQAPHVRQNNMGTPWENTKSLPKEREDAFGMEWTAEAQ